MPNYLFFPSPVTINSNRTYDMGLNLVPTNRGFPGTDITIQEYNNALETIGNHADFLFLHANPTTQDWLDAYQNTLNDGSSGFMLDLETRIEGASGIIGCDFYQTKKMIVLDPLTGDRNNMSNVPQEWGNSSFSLPQIQTALKNMAIKIISRYEPHYLLFASEINSYQQSKGSPEAGYVVGTYRNWCNQIKTLFPQVQLGFSLQYDTVYYNNAFALYNWYDDGANQDSLGKGLIDFIGISCYPGDATTLYPTPKDIPDDFFEKVLTQTNLNVPIVIAETGWQSRNSGSEEEQAEYLIRLDQLLNGKATLVNWWFLHDFENWGGTSSVFDSMGLKRNDGTDKKSWTTWNFLRKRIKM